MFQEGYFNSCVYFNGNLMGHFRYAIAREIISACFLLVESIPQCVSGDEMHTKISSVYPVR